MKKISLLFGSIILPLLLLAQYRINGIVTDEKTGLPLSGASVFCQHTTIGTVTGAEGTFMLTVPDGGYDIVISYSGYETQSTRISRSMENIDSLSFALKEKGKDLEEVAIVATTEVRNGWEKYGRFFVEAFIGATENSQHCDILNPTSLRFFFSKKKNRLKIVGNEDILIQNHALGYRIRYQLDSFIHDYGTGLTQFTGYPLFEALDSTEEVRARWKVKREEAYMGSLIHFMRSFYNRNLMEEGFKLEFTDSTGKQRTIFDPYADDISTVEDGELSIHPPGKLRVVYLDELPESSYLQRNNLSANTSVQISQLDLREPLWVEGNGYHYDQRQMLVLGYWAWEKIADMLPYDFVLNEE
jgi:hypothetical protein